MSQPEKKQLSQTNIEEAFNRHNHIATKVKDEYDNALRQIGADLEPSCLEPFARILLENENTILNKETLIKSVCMKMSQVLPKMNEIFFESFDVGKKLITLEVLKEKFEPHKGTSWNVNKLSPEDRTRSVRMRLMESSIRFIEKQISAQEKSIETALANSRENRERIQHIQNDRIKLYALMQQQAGYYKEMTPKLTELAKQIIEYDD